MKARTRFLLPPMHPRQPGALCVWLHSHHPHADPTGRRGCCAALHVRALRGRACKARPLQLRSERKGGTRGRQTQPPSRRLSRVVCTCSSTLRVHCGRAVAVQVKVCFILEFDRWVFQKATAERDDGALRSWYRDRVVWSNRKFVRMQLANGLFERIYAPSLIMMGLDAAGGSARSYAGGLRPLMHNTSRTRPGTNSLPPTPASVATASRSSTVVSMRFPRHFARRRSVERSANAAVAIGRSWWNRRALQLANRRPGGRPASCARGKTATAAAEAIGCWRQRSTAERGQR